MNEAREGLHMQSIGEGDDSFDDCFFDFNLTTHTVGSVNATAFFCGVERANYVGSIAN